MSEMVRRNLLFRMGSRLRDLTVPDIWRYARRSYSQEGEDLVLERLFEGQQHGFYVDVGAHHPTRFSNTFRFYRRGWRGINIEPNPQALKLFERSRKRDINIGCGVANDEARLTYFMFNEPAVNSFDQELSEQRATGKYKIVERRDIPVRRLYTILEEFAPKGTPIDFLTIDVEGYDLQVLQSNDWSRFRPACLLAESVGFNPERPESAPIHRFLEQNNYAFFAKTLHTLFYLDRQNSRGKAACAR